MFISSLRKNVFIAVSKLEFYPTTGQHGLSKLTRKIDQNRVKDLPYIQEYSTLWDKYASAQHSWTRGRQSNFPTLLSYMSSRFFLSFSLSLPRLSIKQPRADFRCLQLTWKGKPGALTMKDNGNGGKGKSSALWGSVLPCKFLLCSQLRNPAHHSEGLLTQYPDGSRRETASK